MVTRPDILQVLEPGYDALFDQAVQVFAADERVPRCGCRDRSAAAMRTRCPTSISSWRWPMRPCPTSQPSGRTGSRITPTLIARSLPFAPGSLYAVTPERLRIDVVAEPASRVGRSPFRHRVVVFDHDGLDAEVPVPEPVGPSLERVSMLVEEFFRDVGMFPVVLEREDWLLGLEAIHLVRSLLYQLFVEMNAPLPPMGVKQWSAKLTMTQRRVLEALPTGQADRESVVAAHHAVASCLSRTRAAQPAATLGIAWPDDLEAATDRYLANHGVEIRG